MATPPIRQETATPDWAMAEAQEFFPHQFDASSHSQLIEREKDTVIIDGKLCDDVLGLLRVWQRDRRAVSPRGRCR